MYCKLLFFPVRKLICIFTDNKLFLNVYITPSAMLFQKYVRPCCRVIDLQPLLDLCQNASGVGNDPYNPGQGGPWDDDPQ